LKELDKHKNRARILSWIILYLTHAFHTHRRTIFITNCSIYYWIRKTVVEAMSRSFTS